MKMLTVKGHANKIELLFEKDVTVKDAKEALENLSEEEKKFFSKGNSAVAYSGAEFSYDDEMHFERLVKKVFGSNASLIKQHKLSLEHIRYSLEEGETLCKVINKSLRSGDEVSFKGDVIIYGDVNPGASVIADGNITVIGALRGNAHIKKEGRIYATYMHPAQIRIGKIYSYNKKAQNVGAAVAVSENGEIILQSL